MKTQNVTIVVTFSATPFPASKTKTCPGGNKLYNYPKKMAK